MYRKLQTAKNYIDLHFTTIENVESVAKESSISEYHFYRLFKQIFGVSPYHYITQKKLELAQELLRDKVLSVTDVAMVCGFADLASFSKSFKNFFEISPSKI